MVRLFVICAYVPLYLFGSLYVDWSFLNVGQCGPQAGKVNCENQFTPQIPSGKNLLYVPLALPCSRCVS